VAPRAAHGSWSAPRVRTLILRGRAAVLPQGLVGPTELELAGDRIVALRPLADAPSLSGTLVPGFVDLQVNGIDAVDVAAAVGADWDVLDEALLAQGVTSWCPTLVSAPLDRYVAPLARIAAAQTRTTILGAHLEGPFLGTRHGAHPDAFVVPPDPTWVADLPSNVRLMTVGPESPGALDLIRALRDRDVVVAVGHTDAPPELVRAAVDAGATLFTHLWNASGSVGARSPGPIGAALVDGRLAVSLIADLAHVDATSLALTFAAKAEVALVTDAVAWRSDWARSQAIEVVDGAPTLPDGTIAGSSLTMDRAVRNVAELVGLERAVQAASTTPARILGADDRGELAPGRRADVVVLDDVLAVRQTWVGGQSS
jgi:N-acetylglucosamine-6-phosphate deacetylase